jgi:hypothetical protein
MSQRQLPTHAATKSAKPYVDKAENSSCGNEPTGKTGQKRTARQHLLHRYNQGDNCHQRKIHDTYGQLHQHERPAAADAEGAMMESETKSAAPAIASVVGHQQQRIAAMSQAGLLPGSELTAGAYQGQAG